MVEDKFRIDGDKILFHPERVKNWLDSGNDWEKAKKVYPLYIEISPAGSCNHRCTFCAVDFIGYVKRFLDKDILNERLSEIGDLGVKSVMYVGEGEPLLHPNLSEIIQHTKGNAGIDVAITTNATPLKERFVEETLPYITWIKASINAGTAETYSKVHMTRESHFELALGNMGRASRLREKMGLRKEEHTLGAQMVLLPENSMEVENLAKRSRDLGLDYLVVKPYSQGLSSITRMYEGMTYGEHMELEEKLREIETDDFKVVFRRKTMQELESEKPRYKKCQATPFFWAYIMANGNVYGCSAHIGCEGDLFNYGNVNEKTFKEIWEGENRKNNFEFVRGKLDISDCRRNCRMNQVNNTLWDLNKDEEAEPNSYVPLTSLELKNAPHHVNFI